MKGYGLLITSNFYSLSSTKFTYSALEYFLPNVPKISERSLENASDGDQFFLKLGFTPCKDEQLLRAMELQEKEAQKEYSIQEISLERANS